MVAAINNLVKKLRKSFFISIGPNFVLISKLDVKIKSLNYSVLHLYLDPKMVS